MRSASPCRTPYAHGLARSAPLAPLLAQPLTRCPLATPPPLRLRLSARCAPQLLSADVDEVNALRAALSKAAGDPSASPKEGPLPVIEQAATGQAVRAAPAATNGQSASAVQAQLLKLVTKPRLEASDADRAQAAAAIAAALEAVKAGSDGASAIDAARAAESVRLGQDGSLLPPLVSPLYDYSPEEMDGFR